MKILGIDTSTSCGSVGLIENGEVVSDYLLNTPVTHSERLLSAVEFVLKEARCSMKEVDGWAVSLGPGSFTGLRIGVSTIKGLALATGKPVMGVSTLEVLASQIAPTSYQICPILDARKQEVYTALYRYEGGLTLKCQSDEQALSPEDLVKKIGEQTIFLGDGLKTYRDFLKKTLPALAVFAPPSLCIPHGAAVASLGQKALEKGEILNLADFTPLYIRPSEAEVKWRERHSD